MKKMSTLFVVEYDKGKRTIEETIRPENEWIFEPGVLATVKFDGTAAMVLDGILYKRYDAKNGKKAPEGALPCQPLPDPITGHHPHWVKVTEDNPADKYFCEAFKGLKFFDGTYELCGEKVGINAEGIVGHTLIKHGYIKIVGLEWANKGTIFENIKQYLRVTDIEGIVFRGAGGKYCKIRKTDFGFKR